MKKVTLLAAVLILVFISFSFADPLQATRVKLDNGLTVLINEMPSSPVVSVFAWVKTGSANEGKYVGSGITHFVEHMLFKGTHRRGLGVIPDEAKAMGGVINASTGYDYTVFTLTLPKENFSKGLDLIADMVQNAIFDPQETEKEREVILKELRMVNDRPDRKLNEIMSDSVYLAHPYKNPIIGKEDIFKALTRDNLLDYYTTFYVPNNMIVTVAGGVHADDVLSEVKKVFQDFKPKSFPLRNLPQEPEQISTRRVELEYPTDLVRFSMAYQGVPILSSDMCALDVLAMALGNGESSRLYLDVYKKKRLVESIGANDYTPIDRGYFDIGGLLRRDNVDEVLKEIKAVIARVQKNGFDLAELEKVKRQVMVSNVYSRETAESMAYRMSMEEAYTGDYLFSDKYLDGIKAVTNEDIKRVANKYLVDSRLTVAVLKPRIERPKEATVSTQEKDEIEKIVLKNGLRVLLREDHTLPLVTAYAVMNAGTRQEPLELNGITNLTARMWQKGVKGKDADTVSREIESRGASFSIGGGMNTFGLSFSSLSEDTGFVLDYLDKFLKEPTFPVGEIEKEKEQLRTALVARKDSIVATTSKALRETLFLKNPFRIDPLGTEETLARIQRADLEAYCRRFISPDNMVIAIFGDIDKVRIKKEIEKRFGVLAKKDVQLRSEHEDPPLEIRFKELEMPKEQALVMYGFQGPLIQSDDKYSMEVAVNILSSSLGGRMFKRIREELGKAYTLGGGFTPGVDVGMIAFYVLTTNENISKVRNIMEEELKNLSAVPVGEKELLDAKTYLKADFAQELQTVSAQAATSALDELLGLGYQNYQSYYGKIDAVSAEDVQRVVSRYLDIRHSAVVVTRSNMGQGQSKN